MNHITWKAFTVKENALPVLEAFGYFWCFFYSGPDRLLWHISNKHWIEFRLAQPYFPLFFPQQLGCYATVLYSCLCITGHLHEVLDLSEDSRVYVEGIAYDWMNRNIYYTDTGKAEIGVVSVYGHFKKTLHRSNTVGKPRGIVVHPKKGYCAFSCIQSWI